MSDQSPRDDVPGSSPFDELMAGAQSSASGASSSSGSSHGGEFTTTFRGYDKAEVDAAIAALTAQRGASSDELAQLKDTHHRATVELKGHKAKIDELERKLSNLQSDLAVESARAANAEDKVQTLSDELVNAADESSKGRERFEEVLRVAEEQASVIIKNASVQADRLLEAARDEIASQRAAAQADADALKQQAETDAAQARLRIETELTAHTAQLDREAAHAAEKVAQADQEAAAIRTEAEKGAAALRSLVAREAEQARAEADEALREQRMRTLEFEEALTRRQDDAQQEFLMLHNQAVAHAERITQDANEQVAASVEHAQRITAKADDFDKLMRAQSQQVEADAKLRAREILDRASVKAQKIIDTVTQHSQAVLRDAEDRTRALRWQQQQLTSFMSEVKELMRSEGAGGQEAGGSEADDASASGSATGKSARPVADAGRDETAEG
ncbi:DivIVA domain-containing protein [Microbacterium sp. bgisy203]|uniref:DivIVA domain-containing protein n=1 Tax=Microbacterium sp. bgisy203 TaxID=3413799 RepID=UPI003D720C44